VNVKLLLQRVEAAKQSEAKQPEPLPSLCYSSQTARSQTARTSYIPLFYFNHKATT